MMKLMSLNARRELLARVQQTYQDARWADKGKILDGGVIVATGYGRKQAIQLLNSPVAPAISTPRLGCRKYDEQVRQALIAVWYAANQICSKRLVPFMPQLVDAMERHGHLRLPLAVRTRLLRISPATGDRSLAPERERIGHAVSPTRPGSLLKQHIQVRTFAEGDDGIPGFVEADRVAHCGGTVAAAF